jgi:hypothetical protein
VWQGSLVSPEGRGRNRSLVDDEGCFNATSMKLPLRACKWFDHRITNDTPHSNENLPLKTKECCEATDKESSISLSVGDEQQPTRNSINVILLSSH